MLQTERLNDQEEALRTVFDGMARGLWCAMVCTVTAYDATRGTVQVQPAIQAMVSDEKGNVTPTTIAPLSDVPVVYLGGGNFVATFPIQVGDEALVIFADRCIDWWFQYGGVQKPAAPEAHSLSDGFAIIGPRSLARKLSNVSTSNAQLRSLDGTTHIELTPAGQANVVAPAGINLTGPVTINGSLLLNGVATGAGGTFSIGSDVATTGKVTATGEVAGAGVHLSTHLHSGIFSGGSDTNPPVPGS